MPLTPKGRKIKARMMAPPSQGGYGKKQGERVFYASENAGKIKGVHKGKGGGRTKRGRK
jgi:hypothetical protein